MLPSAADCWEGRQLSNGGYRLSTRLVHAGTARTSFGETSEALFLTSGFVYDTAEQAEAAFDGTAPRFQYSRFGNPTVEMLQDKLASLEGAEACRVTATGMAAIHAAMLSHLKTGDRLVASRALFGSCHWIISNLLPRYGIDFEFVDGSNLDSWRAAFQRPASMVLLESPSNPMLDVIDLPAVCALAHQAGALVVVDNVFATPVLQRPLELGADIVVYSCTKHMDGQGRVLGGAVLGSKDWIENTLQPFIRNTGPSLAPFNAWVLLKSLDTLALRVEAGCTRAEAVSEFIGQQAATSRVLYPTRPDHPQHTLAMSQMSAGGTVVTFELAGGKAAAFAFMNALRLIAISNNLGDSKSLATHPATTTHMRIGVEERQRLGISDGVIRLSVGLEDVADLCADLARGFDAIAADTGERQAAE
jgi:O-succinylhomoserine sulfhydrylase